MSARNGLIDLRCDAIVDLSPSGGYRSGMELAIEVRMTKPQMRDAVEQFLEHVTEAELVAWLEELAPSVLTAGAAA